eukprot:10156-Rhodomonas_salina.4
MLWDLGTQVAREVMMTWSAFSKRQRMLNDRSALLLLLALRTLACSVAFGVDEKNRYHVASCLLSCKYSKDTTESGRRLLRVDLARKPCVYSFRHYSLNLACPVERYVRLSSGWQREGMLSSVIRWTDVICRDRRARAVVLHRQ